MATISLDNEIKKYLPLLGSEEKQSILSHIKSFITAKETPNRLTKEEFIVQYNKDIEDAENDIRAGRIISQEELEKESETW